MNSVIVAERRLNDHKLHMRVVSHDVLLFAGVLLLRKLGTDNLKGGGLTKGRKGEGRGGRRKGRGNGYKASCGGRFSTSV